MTLRLLLGCNLVSLLGIRLITLLLRVVVEAELLWVGFLAEVVVGQVDC
jgi:hypothetical protein